jgi:hypothetical protein
VKIEAAGERIEVATGGDPVRAFMEAIDRRRVRAGVYRMSVAHDDGCPCVTHREPLTGCTCEILWITRERLR